MRRALESQSDRIETIGFAGFFGLPVAHRPKGSDELQAHLPALLNPAMISTNHGTAAQEAETRIKARARREWRRFRQAAVSSFVFVEAAGPANGGGLVRDALALRGVGMPPGPMPQIEGGMSAEAKVRTAAAVLRAMSLTKSYARLVLLIGHDAQVTNNPHESVYRSCACCGQTGEVSARLLAAPPKNPETRAGLPRQGLPLPDGTLFVAGLHDAVTDKVTLYHYKPAPGHAADLVQAEAWLAAAGKLSRAERAL